MKKFDVMKKTKNVMKKKFLIIKKIIIIRKKKFDIKKKNAPHFETFSHALLLNLTLHFLLFSKISFGSFPLNGVILLNLNIIKK